MEIFQFHKSHVASADKGIEMMLRLKKGVEDQGMRADGKSPIYQFYIQLFHETNASYCY